MVLSTGHRQGDSDGGVSCAVRGLLATRGGYWTAIDRRDSLYLPLRSTVAMRKLRNRSLNSLPTGQGLNAARSHTISVPPETINNAVRSNY